MTVDTSIRYRSYSEDELPELFSELIGNIRLQYIVSSIRIHLDKLIPSVSMKVLNHEKDHCNYWICLKIFPEKGSQIFVECLEEKMNLDVFERFLRILLEECSEMKEILRLGGFCIYGETNLVVRSEEVFTQLGFQTSSSNPAYFVICSNAQTIPLHILPKGYKIDRIREEDAEFIGKMWRYGVKNEKYYVRKRIISLPSVCIRYEDGEGKSTVAGWALCEHSGMIINLFVMENHRRKGLQKVIMEEVAHEIEKRIGVTPYYGTSTLNESMIKCIDKEYIIRRKDGSPSLVHFSHMEREDKSF